MRIIFCLLMVPALAWATETPTSLTDYRKQNPKAKAPQVCSFLRSQIDSAPALFANGNVNEPPKGDTYGCVVGIETLPGSLSNLVGKFLNLVWSGKKFNEQGTALINKVPPLRLIGYGETATAQVYKTESQLDHQPIYVLDYSHSEENLPLEVYGVRIIRDEIREISPGIYFGPVLLEIRGQSVFTGLYFSVFTGNSGLLTDR